MNEREERLVHLTAHALENGDVTPETELRITGIFGDSYTFHKERVEETREEMRKWLARQDRRSFYTNPDSDFDGKWIAFEEGVPLSWTLNTTLVEGFVALGEALGYIETRGGNDEQYAEVIVRDDLFL